MRFESTHLLACAALAVLAACTMYGNPEQQEANIISPGNFRAGSGQITQVGVLPNQQPAGAGSGERNLYRLYLRMDPPAGTQFVDVDRGHFMAGEYVELTNDGRVVRVSGTTLNEARSGSPPRR